MDELVEPAAALRRAARQLAPLGIGQRTTERDARDEVEVVRDREQLAKLCLDVREDAVHRGAEPFVDRGEEHEHEAAPASTYQKGTGQTISSPSWSLSSFW